METNTSSINKQESLNTNPLPINPDVEKTQPQKDQNVEFWIIDRKILSLNLLECESLWELKAGLLLHPLVMLFSNFELIFNEKPIDHIISLKDYIINETKGNEQSAYRIDLVPGNLNVQESREALLALVRLIQNPTKFLSNQMMRFYEIIGRQDFLQTTLSNLQFDCEELSIDNALSSGLSTAQQFVKLQKQDSNNVLKLDSHPENNVKELQFLRQLVLPVNSQINLQGFEEYFEVLIETIERKYLGFVFCKRGVYLSRRHQNDEISLQLLSLPRENRKRLSGFYPSMIPLLVQESPAFAQRFEELMNNDLSRVENDGIFLILNCSLNDIRYQYKHWIQNKSLSVKNLLGEGRTLTLRNPITDVNIEDD